MYWSPQTQITQRDIQKIEDTYGSLLDPLQSMETIRLIDVEKLIAQRLDKNRKEIYLVDEKTIIYTNRTVITMKNEKTTS